MNDNSDCQWRCTCLLRVVHHKLDKFAASASDCGVCLWCVGSGLLLVTSEMVPFCFHCIMHMNNGEVLLYVEA